MAFDGTADSRSLELLRPDTWATRAVGKIAGGRAGPKNRFSILTFLHDRDRNFVAVFPADYGDTLERGLNMEHDGSAAHFFANPGLAVTSGHSGNISV